MLYSICNTFHIRKPCFRQTGILVINRHSNVSKLKRSNTAFGKMALPTHFIILGS